MNVIQLYNLFFDIMFFKGLSNWLEDKPITTSILFLIVVTIRYTEYMLINFAKNFPIDKIMIKLDKISGQILESVIKIVENNKKCEKKCEECPCEKKCEEYPCEEKCEECPCEEKCEECPCEEKCEECPCEEKCEECPCEEKCEKV
jgi:hypothetical protein